MAAAFRSHPPYRHLVIIIVVILVSITLVIVGIILIAEVISVIVGIGALLLLLLVAFTMQSPDNIAPPTLRPNTRYVSAFVAKGKLYLFFCWLGPRQPSPLHTSTLTPTPTQTHTHPCF
jgi:hypothetical protein